MWFCTFYDICAAVNPCEGLPHVTETRHEGSYMVRCTAEGNQYRSISWMLNHGPEIVSKLDQLSKLLRQACPYVCRVK